MSDMLGWWVGRRMTQILTRPFKKNRWANRGQAQPSAASLEKNLPEKMASPGFEPETFSVLD